jgi:hypothetical protein
MGSTHPSRPCLGYLNPIPDREALRVSAHSLCSFNILLALTAVIGRPSRAQRLLSSGHHPKPNAESQVAIHKDIEIYYCIPDVFVYVLSCSMKSAVACLAIC